MSQPTTRSPALQDDVDVYVRALDARDARFDGIFFVGIITTRIYCRPICPARVSNPDHRRFFGSAAAAERAGYRPCRRCRPELAPGRAPVNAVSRLAHAAAQRIAAGALNGRVVGDLAGELCVSERHLRRALARAVGVSPVQLAQTHRLLLAKRLLTDTALPVSRVAYSSGFQSLRRFNDVFRERYRMAPSDLRRGARGRRAAPANDLLRLTLAYRAPLARDALIAVLRRDATAGVEVVRDGRYARTVSLDGHAGVVFAEDAAAKTGDNGRRPKTHMDVDVSYSLLPVLMPLIARLRRLFDLDAEPAVVDACLERSGLGPLVGCRPGLRIPGAFDGFEVALRALLRGRAGWITARTDLAGRVARELGEPMVTGVAELDRLAPTAERVADAGASRLAALGLPPRRADTVAAFTRAVADGALRLEPGGDVVATRRALMEIDGVGDRLATTIVMRTLSWPDAFPAPDRALQRAAGVSSARELRARAEAWRPWRAYAALHLRLHDEGR